MRLDALYRELPDSFDERVPAPQPTPKPTGNRWVLAFGTFIYLLVTAAGLVWLVPKFSEVYDQIKIHVPLMTRVLLGLSRVTGTHLWLVGAVLALVPWGFGRLRGRWATLASILVSIGGIATWAWMMVALFLPLIGFLEGIGPIKR